MGVPGEDFDDVRRGVRNELGADSSCGGPGGKPGSRKSNGQASRSGKSRAASFFGEHTTPRVHKAAPKLLKNGSIEFGVHTRLTPLKDASDEVSLREGQVCETLVASAGRGVLMIGSDS